MRAKPSLALDETSAKMSARLTRRAVVGGLALIGSAGAGRPLGSESGDAPRPPVSHSPPSSEPDKWSEWQKFSKEVAGYVERGKRGPETCMMCQSFIDPNSCILVAGDISPTGWCNYGSTTG